MEPQANPVSDAELLQAYAQTRSDASFAQLVNRYVDLVYSTSLRRVRDSHMAEDVTQAVFLVLAKKAARLPPTLLLSGWLFKTARNISADAIKMQRRRLYHERAAAVMHSSIDSGGERRNDVLLHLEAGMDRLPAADRNALLLRYFQGLTVTEVARQLRLTDNTAVKRIGRALNRLRSNLLDLGVKGPATEIDCALADRAIQAAPAALSSLCLPGATAATSVPISLARRAIRVNWLIPLTSVGVGAVVIAGWVGIHSWIRSSSPANTVAAPPAIVAAQADPQLEPNSPAQELQIRAAVSTLRHANEWARPAEWANAIRTLVQIGSPAVPELVAELDRTNKDGELRAMAFTLRAIDDARACPALIRASRRTVTTGSSGIGMLPLDADVTKFMISHGVRPGLKGTRITIDTADSEINSALEAITLHNAGPIFDWRSGVITDEELAASKKRQTELANAWQKWWDANHDTLVSDADLATLTAHPHTVEAVEAAGNAVNGPLFPTGYPYHLGPVHDLWLDEADLFDRHILISFDHQQVMTMLDCVLWLPADMRLSQKETNWYIQPPLAIDADCQHLMFPTTTKPTHGSMNVSGLIDIKPGEWKDYYTLGPISMAIWPTDNQTWETLEATIDAGKPVSLEEEGPYSDFNSIHGHHIRGEPPLPATFLVRTNRGVPGMIQLMESDGANGRLHFRYRMVEPSLKPIPPLVPTTLPAGKVFSETKEATLAGPKPDSSCAFNVSSEKVINAPASIEEVDRHQAEWMKDQNADLVSMHFYRSDKLAGVCFRDAAVLRLSSKQFDEMSPGMAALAIGHFLNEPDMSSIQYASKGDTDHITALFRTRDGAAGMIQIIDISDNPPSLRFRYKLIKNAE